MNNNQLSSNHHVFSERIHGVFFAVGIYFLSTTIQSCRDCHTKINQIITSLLFSFDLPLYDRKFRARSIGESQRYRLESNCHIKYGIYVLQITVKVVSIKDLLYKEQLEVLYVPYGS